MIKLRRFATNRLMRSKLPMHFDENGWLQPSGLLPNRQEAVEQLFVTNSHRQLLWDQFKVLLSRLVQQSIPVYAIWLDGSFVSTKGKPKDIDIVIFTEVNFLNTQFRLLDELRNQFDGLNVFWASASTKEDEVSVAITKFEELKWDWVFGMNRAKKAKEHIVLTD